MVGQKQLQVHVETSEMSKVNVFCKKWFGLNFYEIEQENNKLSLQAVCFMFIGLLAELSNAGILSKGYISGHCWFVSARSWN